MGVLQVRAGLCHETLHLALMYLIRLRTLRFDLLRCGVLVRHGMLLILRADDRALLLRFLLHTRPVEMAQMLRLLLDARPAEMPQYLRAIAFVLELFLGACVLPGGHWVR
jgi:hypothetical protein